MFEEIIQEPLQAIRDFIDECDHEIAKLKLTGLCRHAEVVEDAEDLLVFISFVYMAATDQDVRAAGGEKILGQCVGYLLREVAMHTEPVTVAESEEAAPELEYETKSVEHLHGIEKAVLEDAYRSFREFHGVAVPIEEYARLLSEDTSLYGDLVSWGTNDTVVREKLGDPVARELLGVQKWPYRDLNQLQALRQAAVARGWEITDENPFLGRY